jgi:hypothetical protein
MTAEQIVEEILALPIPERARLVECMRRLDEVPADFLEALDDFENGRFVSMETALHEDPPAAK